MTLSKLAARILRWIRPARRSRPSVFPRMIAWSKGNSSDVILRVSMYIILYILATTGKIRQDLMDIEFKKAACKRGLYYT
jgi:hypothetical protein